MLPATLENAQVKKVERKKEDEWVPRIHKSVKVSRNFDPLSVFLFVCNRTDCVLFAFNDPSIVCTTQISTLLSGCLSVYHLSHTISHLYDFMMFSQLLFVISGSNRSSPLPQFLSNSPYCMAVFVLFAFICIALHRCIGIGMMCNVHPYIYSNAKRSVLTLCDC